MKYEKNYLSDLSYWFIYFYY